MELSLNEVDFVKKALKDGAKRLDHRALHDFRQVFLQPGQRPGQVMARIGDTKVYAAVTADVVIPPLDRAFEGQLQVFVEVFPGAYPPDTLSTDLDGSKMSLQRLLDRSIKMSKSVDTESLCILPGQRVWSIRVDVHVLDDDGSVGDAAVLAAMTALSMFKRPAVQVEEGQVKVFSEFEKHPVPLTIMHFPFSCTFAFSSTSVGEGDDQSGDTKMEDSSITPKDLVLCDPSYMEEKALDGCMTIVMNRQGELIGAIKAGGLPLAPDCIAEQCMTLAKARTAYLHDAMMACVKAL